MQSFEFGCPLLIPLGKLSRNASAFVQTLGFDASRAKRVFFFRYRQVFWGVSMTAYDDLPRELRALIWKKRTQLRNDAAIIIFRNLVRNTITKNLHCFLEQELADQLINLNDDENDYDFDINYISAGADQYLDHGDDTIAGFENEQLTLYASSFATDMRNILLSDMYYQVLPSEEGQVCLTDVIREARDEFKTRCQF